MAPLACHELEKSSRNIFFRLNFLLIGPERNSLFFFPFFFSLKCVRERKHFEVFGTSLLVKQIYPYDNNVLFTISLITHVPACLCLESHLDTCICACAYSIVVTSVKHQPCNTTFNAPRPSLFRVSVKKGPDPAFPLLFH